MALLTPDLRSLLIAEAERARIAVDARCAAVSQWDREDDLLRTLVNVGELLPGEDRYPRDELYPLDTFPAPARLIRARQPYLNPGDVSSAAVAAHHRYGSNAGVPIVVDDDVWGELWVVRAPEQPTLTLLDIDRLHLVASRLGAGLGGHAG